MYIKLLDHGSSFSRAIANTIVGAVLTLLVAVPTVALLAHVWV